MRYLIVDDDPVICANVEAKLHRLLVDKAHETQTAFNVVDAQLAISNAQPDVLITDINMPGISGLILIKYTKKNCPNARIYVLSGYDDYSLVRRAFLNGADDYLLKPVDIEELREKVICNSVECEKANVIESQSIWQMEKAIKYIDDNITKNLTMDDVATQVSVSYNYFSRLFKEHTGAKFPEYMHKRRIELSKRYLSDPSARVSDIARKVGYDTSSSYSRAFKRYEGCYPSDYRKQIE